MASFAMPQGVTVEAMLEAMGAPAADAVSAPEPKPAAAPARRKTEAPAKS